MTPSAPPRIGVLRSDQASPDPVVALAEARVVRHELTRRLGDVSIDFRTNDAAHAPWVDLTYAAWPSDVDATIELAVAPPFLTALFARTIELEAAEVRARMLSHLGVLPVELLDDAELERRLPRPRRPTDVWLLVRSAEQVRLSDPSLRAFTAEPDDVERADAWFDERVEALSIDPAPTIMRLTARIDELRSELVSAESDNVRNERLLVDRIDELEAENQVLSERLIRSELARQRLADVGTDLSDQTVGQQGRP